MYSALCGALLALILPVVTQAQGVGKRLLDMRVPMRDGVELATDVWLPLGASKHPLILMRTPYLKASLLDNPKLARFFVERGYAFAVQDVRGRGDSGGIFNYHFQEADDGYDAIEWLATQPWSNGRVGMMGYSYGGVVQWQAARRKPPHLVCIAPTAAPGDYLNEVPYVGGAFLLQNSLTWRYAISGRVRQGNLSDQEWENVFAHRPLITADEIVGRAMPGYREWLQHYTLDDYWLRAVLAEQDFRNIDLPVLHISGWFDGDLPGTIRYWEGMAKYSPASSRQYLIVGPWEHVETFTGGKTKKNGMEFSSDSVVDIYQVHLEFFETYLKQRVKTFAYPRARIYVTGRNEWRDLETYPIAGQQVSRLYLSSRGRANSLFGDGRLVFDRPTMERPDQFEFDPKSPVPLDATIPGGIYAVDRRALERRDDVLVYTSEALNAALEVIGQASVELYAASDARDTDFTASILDVYPDGRVVVLGARVVGIIRARYRYGLERTELLTPGKVEKYQIDLGHLAHSFQPGHRIRIEISSSAAPMYNPNQNTGNPVATDTEWRTARQTIYHDPEHPSHLIFSIMSRATAMRESAAQ